MEEAVRKALTLESIKPTRISDVIVEQLERLILDGVLRPGDKLPSERELAQMLEVSRPSLREAITKLEAKGLLQSQRGAGTRVTEIQSPTLTDPLFNLLKTHPSAIGDVLELRHALEEAAAYYAAKRATHGDRELLRRRFEALMVATQQEDVAFTANADADFHLAIADASHNVALIHVMRLLLEVMRENITRNLSRLSLSPTYYSQLDQQHRDIFQAIIAGDAQAARQSAHHHITYIEASMAEGERQRPLRELGANSLLFAVPKTEQ